MPEIRISWIGTNNGPDVAVCTSKIIWPRKMSLTIIKMRQSGVIKLMASLGESREMEGGEQQRN